MASATLDSFYKNAVKVSNEGNEGMGVGEVVSSTHGKRR